MMRSSQESRPYRVRPLRHALRGVAPGWALVACWLALVFVAPARAETDAPRGKVLLVRGFMTVFSLGLDDLAKKLPPEELDVRVVPAAMSRIAVRQIAQQYARGELQGPLVLIGHSLGGDLLPGLAQQLDAAGQQVDLMVMIDSTNPSDAPRNVRRCVNMYQSNFSPTWFRVFRGVPIRAVHADTQLVNVDIRQLPERDEAAKLNHFNIEASTWIHDMVIREVEYAVKSFGR